MRHYETPDANWIELGVTPIAAISAPRGVLLLEIEKRGFVTNRYAVANPGPMLANTIFLFDAPTPEIELTLEGSVPDDMVRIPATDMPIFLLGFTRGIGGDARYAIPAFAIGRTEVSNREYKTFIDVGGYANLEYWRGLMSPDGRPLTPEWMRGFVDSSGRPGPANWELGTYPTGAADLPVGGLSWYEAMAYARYRNLTLPTLHHWARAALAPAEAGNETAPAISRDSNFDATGPVAAASEAGIGPWGTVHTAGNMREWVWTQADNQGLAMGGAWSDYPGTYQHAYTLDPLDRSPQNGVRLMHTLGEPIDEALLASVTLNRDTKLTRRVPVSDEAFEAMRFQFTHARRTPQSVEIEVVQENDTWVAEEVLLTLSSEDVRTLYVVKPVGASTALQPVVYMPHGGAFTKIPNREMLTHIPRLDFIVRGGRALIMPIWANSAQRFDPPPTDSAELADGMRRLALAWHDDAATVIDYLESREDIDARRVGYIGSSYGAIFGPIPLSTESRFAAAVLIAGGITNTRRLHPMLDPINYASHVTLPVLMINGRYDHLYLYENSQKRLFDLLGTPAADKRHLLFDKGHFDFPRHQVAREVSDWFDRYLERVGAE